MAVVCRGQDARGKGNKGYGCEGDCRNSRVRFEKWIGRVPEHRGEKGDLYRWEERLSSPRDNDRRPWAERELIPAASHSRMAGPATNQRSSAPGMPPKTLRCGRRSSGHSRNAGDRQLRADGTHSQPNIATW